MKIVHLSLCGPVTDNWNYQDNLLTKYHFRLGNQVTMITSKYIWNKSGELTETKLNYYFNDDGVKLIRLENAFNTNINSKFKLYKNLYDNLDREKPDILFIHGVQFLNMLTVRKYIKNNPEVVVYVDNHADFSNSATNLFSKLILHKIIWRRMARLILPYTTKFYGVMPSRVKFLEDIYQIPSNKTDLLIMGADDEKINNNLSSKQNKTLKNKLNISSKDFVIVTGGKIDLAKSQTILLMKAVNELTNSNIKLIIFGSVAEELYEEFNNNLSDKIIFLGWVNSEDTYQIFNVADLVCFPGRHSVFWEQVVALGKPLLVKFWEGTTHVDLGGNVKYIEKDTSHEIKLTLKSIIEDSEEFDRMKNIAQSDLKNKFYYSSIAQYSLSNIN